MVSYLKAKLTSWKRINIVLFTDMPRPEKLSISLFKEEKLIKKFETSHFTSINSLYITDILLDEDYELGKNYRLLVGDLSFTNIDLSEAVYFHGFDDRYFYNGDDLGSIYSKEATKFTLWSPLATEVKVKLISPDNEVIVKEMVREDKGIYRLKVDGDLLNYKYRYVINNYGVVTEAKDLYGKEVSLNSEYSVVIDTEALLNIPNVTPKTEINQPVDAVIYETHIRDLNEGNFNDTVAKGKYAGFAETGRKSVGGHPVGLDYIKYLGVTHVQLQPVLDFESKDDQKVSDWYNWGYDTLSFFALEGSYALHPEVPTSRILEFKNLVNKYHENDLRIVMDVVYNHIFAYENSDFEKTVPHYYFRRRKNHYLSNASGCGNDFASERKMASKIIVDSVKYLFKYFDIDGLRFDLMGLLDIDTVKACYAEAKKIKKDAIIYGEGWDMGEELPHDKKASKNNFAQLKEVGFFNDSYRDIVKGPSSLHSLHEKGYICGNTSYAFGLDFAFHAGVLPLSYQPMFNNANQSVNYLECHDNSTLYDKLVVSNALEDEKTLLDRVSLANQILLLSFGIPLIHAGQEIGQSKDGLDNTYKTIGVNNLNYRLIDERFDMVNRFRLFNILRKKLAYTRLSNASDMKGFFEISHWDNGVYVLASKEKNVFANEKEFVILINPTGEKIHFELDDYYTVIDGIDIKNKLTVKNGFLPGSSLLLLYK